MKTTAKSLKTLGGFLMLAGAVACHLTGSPWVGASLTITACTILFAD